MSAFSRKARLLPVRKASPQRASLPPPARAPKAEHAPPSLTPFVTDTLRSSTSAPLEAGTRIHFEQRFGHDFSRVRVHTDERAAHSARALGARAYTVGRDIVFGAGHYVPHSAEGRRLLAHELAHTVQQRDSGAVLPSQMELSPPGNGAELEADAVAHEVTRPDGDIRGRGPDVQPPSVALHAAAPGLLLRVPAAPSYNGVTATLDRSKVDIAYIEDFVATGAGGAVTIPSQSVTVTISDPAVVHLSWELYDPADQLLPGSFSTLKRRPDATTAPFPQHPLSLSSVTEGRHILRCIGRNAAHEPVVYADRSFYVWKTPPLASKDLASLNAIKANPAGSSLGEVGAAYGRSMLLEHRAAVSATGTGKYMGNQVSGAAPAGVEKQDCTTYVLAVLKQAFTAKGKAADWKVVFDEAVAKSGGPFKGVELLKALTSKAGWKAVFWSPDPRNPEDKKPEHPVAYKEVKSKGTYYGVPVEASKSVIDYRPTSPTKQENMTNLDQLRRVPLGVIAARGGMHMTLLINGQVYEVHWDKPATDPNVIEAQPLERWEWQSGVVVMPPEDYTKVWSP